MKKVSNFFVNFVYWPMGLNDLIMHKRLFYKEYIDLSRLLAKS